MSHARLVRCLGLAGSLLLALSAHLGGVRSPWRPNIALGDLLRGEHGTLMPLSWVAGTVLLGWAWWAGRDAVRSVRWAYVTAGLWLLPMLAPAVLGSRDIYSYACQGAVVAAGADPYRAGPQALGCPWLEATAPIWRDAPAPYGPLFVVLAGAAATLGGTLAGTLALLRVIAVAGVALTAVCLPVLARHAGVPPHRAVWWALACPLVGVHLVSGAHNDAVMVGLTVAGLAVVAANAARPGGPGWALVTGGGALLGLAVAVKATAVVVVPFAALAAVAGAAPARHLIARGGAVAAGAAGALLGVSAAAGLGLGWVRALSGSGDSVQWTSPPTAVGLTVDYLGRLVGQRWHAVPVTRLLGLAVLAVVLVALFLRARRGDPLLGAGLALAATVALAPVFHPWYATWPLTVLAATWARPSPLAARLLLVPCALAGALVLPDGTSLALGTRFPGAVVMTVVVLVAGWRLSARLRGRPAPAGMLPAGDHGPAARGPATGPDRRAPDG
jgi:hypothetical protein